MQDKVVYIVGTRIDPKLEAKYNDWCDETHVPMLFKSRWVDVATRYKLAPIAEGDHPEYVAIYEFKDRKAFDAWYAGPERAAARENTKETWGEKGPQVKWRALYEPIRSWRK